MTSFHRESNHVEIYIRGDENRRTTPGDVGLFLYDTMILYELGRLATDPSYSDYSFSNFTLYRNARRLREQDRLYIDSLRIASPLEAIATVAAMGAAASSVTGAIWILVQTFEKISNLRLNREKLELEIQKLRTEGLSSNQESPKVNSDFRDNILEGHIINEEAFHLIDKLGRRLEKSPVQVDELEVRVVNPSHDAARSVRW